MRYIVNSNGYLQEVSFGAMVTCASAACTEYTGSVPAGYSSLAAWFVAEADKLYQWKIVDGELVKDTSVAAPVMVNSVPRCYGKLTDIGITTFPTTMKTVANTMPANSVLVLDSRDITDDGTYEISDLGQNQAGMYVFFRGNTNARLSLLHIYGATGATTSRLQFGTYAATNDAVVWLRAYDDAYAGSNATLYSGSLTSGSITFDYKKYKQFVIVGKMSTNGSLTSITVPREAITTTATSWMLAGSSYYVNFNLSYSGDKVTLAFSTATGSGGQITGVYGVI